MKMKLWKIGAVIGAIWGLLGGIFLITMASQLGMRVPGQPPIHDYILIIDQLGRIVFFPIFACISITFDILIVIFPNAPLSNSIVLILFPIYGALIGAGIGYLFEMLGI